MRYLSVCSGIDAASAAWGPLGWECVGLSEIDPFCCEVLKARIPNVKNYGDIKNVRKIKDFDLLVGGTPCTDVSIAGKRQGLHAKNSGLAYEFVRLLSESRPRWFVWENVPGVLSCQGGRVR